MTTFRNKCENQKIQGWCYETIQNRQQQILENIIRRNTSLHLLPHLKICQNNLKKEIYHEGVTNGLKNQEKTSKLLRDIVGHNYRQKTQYFQQKDSDLQFRQKQKHKRLNYQQLQLSQQNKSLNLKPKLLPQQSDININYTMTMLKSTNEMPKIQNRSINKKSESYEHYNNRKHNIFTFYNAGQNKFKKHGMKLSNLQSINQEIQYKIKQQKKINQMIQLAQQANNLLSQKYHEKPQKQIPKIKQYQLQNLNTKSISKKFKMSKINEKMKKSFIKKDIITRIQNKNRYNNLKTEYNNLKTEYDQQFNDDGIFLNKMCNKGKLTQTLSSKFIKYKVNISKQLK